MALLDVDEVEAGPERQRGRVDVTVLQTVELVVGDERGVGRRPCVPVALSTIVRGSSSGSCWARIGRGTL